MLDPVGREDLDMAGVAADRNRDHHGPLRRGQPGDDRLVDVRVGNRLLELRQRRPKERRVPLELHLFDRRLLQLGHDRSLGPVCACRGRDSNPHAPRGDT